jgi:hypothetical protein
MNNKVIYRSLCEKHKEIPLFMQAWWLDAASKDNWNVIFSRNGDEITGFFVFSHQNKFGKKIVTNHPLTQYAGPYVFYPEGLNKSEIYSFENKVYTSLIEQLEAKNFDFIEINCHRSFQNWQQFFWSGYKQTTKYTYILENISDRESLLKDMSYSQRGKRIKKDAGKYHFSLELSAEDFYDFYNANLKEQDKTIFYSKEYFLRLYNAAKDRNQGQIIGIYNTDNELLAALWTVWDSEFAYNMIMTSDKNKKCSEGTTLLIWETLDFLKDKTKNYDFEGSMIKGVALRNQSYGATAVPYHSISKSNSLLMSAWKKYQEYKNQQNIKKTSLK